MSTVQPLSPSPRPQLTPFSTAYDDGRTQSLLCLHGTLPITYRQATYNIPVAIWITRDYPREHPIPYVVATPDMLIRSSQHIDLSGRCNVEYAQNWQRKSEVRDSIPSSDLLIQPSFPSIPRVATSSLSWKPCRTTSPRSLRCTRNQKIIRIQNLPPLRHRPTITTQNRHPHSPVHSPSSFSSLDHRKTCLSRQLHHHRSWPPYQL